MMVALGKTVRFIADALEEESGFGGQGIEADSVCLVGRVKFFFALGKGYHAPRELGRFLDVYRHDGIELGFAAVNYH